MERDASVRTSANENASLRSTLRAEAEAALARTGSLKAFSPSLAARFERDHFARRRDEVRKLINMAIVGFLAILLTFDVLVAPEPRLAALSIEAAFVIGLQRALYWMSGARPLTGAQIEAVIVISALILVAVALIDFWTGPPALQLASFMTIATVIFGAVHFCRMPMPAAACFVALSLVFLTIVLLTSSLSADIRLFPLASALGSGVFALLGVRDFAEVSRRLYLHDLLQSLQIEGLTAENSTLNELSTTDPLTGVGNRRAFELAFESPQFTGATLALVDLDYFKQLNDRFGHLVGDACLKTVAAGLAARLRPTDVVARIGGDEFAILAFDRSPRESIDLLAGLSNEIAALRPDGAPRGAVLSVSVGAARRRIEESAQDLIRRADAALYNAKRAGRGCETWATDDPPARATAA